MWQDVLTLALCLRSMAQEKMAWNDLTRNRLFRILKGQVPRERTLQHPINTLWASNSHVSCSVWKSDTLSFPWTVLYAGLSPLFRVCSKPAGVTKVQ